MKNVKGLYGLVADANENTTARDVRNIFIWYDLFGFALSFQLLFIFAYLKNWGYAVTTFSTIFIVLIDTIIKEILAKDVKNYKKLKNELPLVKLWVIPLLAMALVTTASLLYIKFFI